MSLLKLIYGIVLCSVTSFSCGQSHTHIELPINKSNAHIDIPGYTLSIVPPNNTFTVSDRLPQIFSEQYTCTFDFSNFNDSKDVVLKELFSPDNLLQSDLEIDADISGFLMEGKILKLKFPQNSDWEIDSNITWLFLLGNNEITYTITVKYPEKFDKDLSDKILNSLSSVFYDEKNKVDPFKTLPFTFEVSKSGLKYAGLSYGTLVFTPGGEIPRSPDDTALTIISFPMFIAENDRKKFASDQIKSDYAEIIEQNAITYDSTGGYEIIGKVLSNGSLIYWTVLFNQERVIMIGCTSKDYNASSIEMFRDFIITFKRR